MEGFSALIGFVVILGIAFLLSNNKRAIRWRTVGWGLALQIVIAITVLKGELIAQTFAPIALPLERYGAAILFIVLAIVVYQLAVRMPLSARRPIWYAFGVVSLYLFLTFNLLAYLFERLKDIVNNLMSYTAEGSKFVFGPLGASGAESPSVAASIFMGQTEAPLTIRPFLPDMTMSELMTIMTAGMAHVSGAIMAAYVMIAKVDVIHLLTAVIMTAPGAIMMAKSIVPEVEQPKTGGDVEVVVPKQ